MCSTPSENAWSAEMEPPLRLFLPMRIVINRSSGSPVFGSIPTSTLHRVRVLSTLARNLVMLQRNPPSNPEFWI